MYDFLSTQGRLTSHGTDDVVGSSDDYVKNARQLLTYWVEHPDEKDMNALKPYQNAENIAAAATGMNSSHVNRGP